MPAGLTTPFRRPPPFSLLIDKSSLSRPHDACNPVERKPFPTKVRVVDNTRIVRLAEHELLASRARLVRGGAK